MGEEFKLPGSSYEELVKIIKAYAQTKDSSLDELSKLCGVSPTSISRNSGFLVATNIVNTGKQKEISDTGKKLWHALQHNVTDEISRVWREIVSENEFLSKMVTAIKIRNGMDTQSFQSHIAYSSGLSNNQYVKTGANTVIDILKIANLIDDVDGKLISKEQGITNKQPLQEVGEKTNINEVNTVVEKIPQARIDYHTKSGITVNLDIKIIAKVSEIDDLGIKLRKIIKDIEATED